MIEGLTENGLSLLVSVVYAVGLLTGMFIGRLKPGCKHNKFK